LALPCPPTPITAIFNLFAGEEVIKLGIKNAPAVSAPADLRKSLLVGFMIVYGLNNLIFKYRINRSDLILLTGIISATFVLLPAGESNRGHTLFNKKLPWLSDQSS
jgi:hypothetical protein